MITTVREGKAIGVRGSPDHPFTRGGLCVKVNDYQNRVYSADRVLFPLARTGREGSGQFERITWDEALSAIKTRWASIIDQHGPAAILPYSSLGNEGVLNGLNVGDASFNTLGAAISERTFCDSGAITAFFMSCGPTAAIDPESFVHSRSIILWAINAISNNLHHWPFIAAAQERGARDAHRRSTPYPIGIFARSAERHLGAMPQAADRTRPAPAFRESAMSLVSTNPDTLGPASAVAVGRIAARTRDHLPNWLIVLAMLAATSTGAERVKAAPAPASEAMTLVEQYPHAYQLMSGLGVAFALGFDRPLNHIASGFTLVTPNGQERTIRLRIDTQANTLYASVGRLDPGGYELRWHARAVDGRAMSGVFPFTVGAVGRPGTEPSSPELGAPEVSTRGT